MFSKLSAHSKVERILLVSLSNIGDVILTFPVFDTLRATFPDAAISVVVGPKGRTFFSHNPHVHRAIVYDKAMPWTGKLRWLAGLRRQRFDLVVDLRNSMLPFLLNARVVTPPAFRSAHCHMKEKHLRRLALVLDAPVSPTEKYAGVVSVRGLKHAGRSVPGQEGYVLFAPGAADPRKRWSAEGFAKAIQHVINRYGKRVVIVGDRRDCPLVERILKNVRGRVVNLCGLTTLTELVGVMHRAGLAVTNDSGVMHLASYFDVPTIALFGPTDPFFYGPWSSQNDVIRKGSVMSEIAATDVIKVLDQRIGKKSV
jgi:ADP-heptose:LPS heptosyltransferase